MTLDESEARGLLGDADLVPPKIDLDEVMKQGRRKRTRRHVAGVTSGVALAVALTAAVAVPIALRGHNTTVTNTAAATRVLAASPAAPKSPAAISCTASLLPLPSGVSNILVNLVDSSGRYAAGYYASNTVYRTVYWNNGRAKVLALPGSMPSVDAINAQGVIVGHAAFGGTHGEQVFRIVSGEATTLQSPMSGPWHLYSVYMNDRGDIVANAEPAANAEGNGAVTLLWKAGSDTAVRLPLPERSEVFGITNDGKIVGDMLGDGGYTYMWDNTGHNGRKLPVPVGSTSSMVDGVSVTGDLAVGRARYESPSSTASSSAQPGANPGNKQPSSWPVEWNLRTGTVKRLTDSSDSDRFNGSISVNAAGSLVVNRGANAEGSRILGVSTIVSFTGATAHLPPVKTGYTAGSALIADNGVVVGNSTSPAPKYDSVPTIWHC